MTTLVPRPGPAVIQRANSLQASDTSHTSGSTTDASTNTSISLSKPSPVSSIGESISSVVHKPTHINIPAARPSRPLPIPPSLSPPIVSPGLTSTSTLKLSHQESHSTLGKSTQPSNSKPGSSSTLTLTKSKTTPPRKLTRGRPDADPAPAERAPIPPPSAFNTRRISEDNNWVSISILPAVSERLPDERFPPEVRSPMTEASYAKPTTASTSKRSASATRSTKSSTKAPARSASANTRVSKATPGTASKSLPRLPDPPPGPLTQSPQPQQDTAWKLEFRGMVRLVRWVSRRDSKDKRGPVSESESPDLPEDEKLPLEEKENAGARRGFSVSNEARRNRDSYTQPMPKPGAPVAAPSRARPLSIVRPRPKLEGEEQDGKRRLTKSNPGLVNFTRASTDLGPETSQRTRTSAEHRTSSDVGHRLGMSPNGGGVFIPDAPLSVRPPRSSSLSPATSSISVPPPSSIGSGIPSVQLDPPASASSLAYLQPELGSGPTVINGEEVFSVSGLSRLPNPASTPGTHITTVTETTQTATQTTTTHTIYTTQNAPFVQSSTVETTQTQTSSLGTTQTQSALGFTYSPFSGHAVLSPVMEDPLFSSELVASPPELGTSEFPWTANVPRVEVGHIVPSESAIFSTDGPNAGRVDAIVTEVLGNAPIGARNAFTSLAAPSDTLSPASSNSLSPLGASPLSSGSLSPLMSNSVSPMMSNLGSPIMPSNAYLADPYSISQTPATTASSLSYATARSHRNNMTAQAIFESMTAENLQMNADPSAFDHSGPNESAYLHRLGAATDIGHGYSTRATSPTPSDRYALSEDVHEHRPGRGILRALSSIDHSGAPLPRPRRPFMPSRGSSGSVTFDDSSAQSSPRMGGRRKIMTMSASDVGHGDRFSSSISANHYGYGRPKPEMHRSKSTLSIASRIIRKLSIGSNSGSRGRESGQESESERPRMTRKLTRRKTTTAASSVVSLVYDAGPTGVPPVPPLPPGVVPSKYVRTESEIGHGQSELGHASVNGHTRGESIGGYSAWNGSTSVFTHETSESHTLVSPAPTRSSFLTTQSAPATSGRKLVKKKILERRAETLAAGMPVRTLASLDLQGDFVSRNPPKITTQFVQVPLLPDDHHLTTSAGATTEDGHLMPPRPGMPRRTSSQRRWTIADIDDDEFLRQLEAKLSGSGSRLRKSRVLEGFAMGADQGHEDIEAEEDPGSETDDSAAEREWVKARQAVMCVREIVRTEKSYLKHLTGFFNADDCTSSTLLEHLPRLIETSRVFTSQLEEDPSAWGVSNAFLAIEEQLEGALVEWSGVVGQVISSRSRGESQATSEDGHTSSAGNGGASSSWMRRRSATASSAAQAFPLSLAMTPVIGSKDKKSSRAARSRRPTEEDVAIMPTQRVLRYVLMYRELLLHTPVKSASRPLVERALQGATRIARRCDDAQKHLDILSPI